MLKVKSNQWPPHRPDAVSFSERSQQTLETDRRGVNGGRNRQFFDRTAELGANIGDLLSGINHRQAALEIADKLSGDIVVPEQAEAFRQGLINTMHDYAAHKSMQALEALEAAVLTDIPVSENGAGL